MVHLLDGGPTRRLDSMVLGLPRHQVGGTNGSECRRPVRAGRDDDVTGVELSKEGECVAIVL